MYKHGFEARLFVLGGCLFMLCVCHCDHSRCPTMQIEPIRLESVCDGRAADGPGGSASSPLCPAEQQPESARAHVCCEQHMSRPACCWPTRVSVFTSSNLSAGINRLLLNNRDLDLAPRKAAVSWVATSSYFYTFAQQEQHHYITWSWTWKMQFSIKVDFKNSGH